MRHAASLAALVLLLMPAVGLAAEESTALPVPQCLTRDGQPLPEGKDPVPVAALSERPVKISGRGPGWPSGVKGCPFPPRVWVQAVISTTGEVCAAGLLKPLPEGCEPFGESAVKTLRTWRFRPNLREGAPVAVLYYLGIAFGQEGAAPPP